MKTGCEECTNYLVSTYYVIVSTQLYILVLSWQSFKIVARLNFFDWMSLKWSGL